jgi:hypothetical protein
LNTASGLFLRGITNSVPGKCNKKLKLKGKERALKAIGKEKDFSLSVIDPYKTTWSNGF